MSHTASPARAQAQTHIRAHVLRVIATSICAGALTYVVLTTWAGFSERPGDYLRPLAVSCAVVAVVGAAGRITQCSSAVVVGLQTLALLLWLNHWLAADASLLGWIPTLDSLAAGRDAFEVGLERAREYAAPLPRTVTDFAPVLVLLGSLTALSVDILACAFNRVTMAGLPLLAMFTAPVSMLSDDPNWWVFPVIAVLFMALLALEQREAHSLWGQELDPAGAGGEHRHSAIWPTAGRIGLSATALAMVSPLLIPTFQGSGLFQGGIGKGGNDKVQITNPVLDLRRNLSLGLDVELLRLRTDDPDPAYLRIGVLDKFDGEWKPSPRDIPASQRANGALPDPVGLSTAIERAEHDYEISASSRFSSRWLPIPFPASQAEVTGDWRYDSSTMDILSTKRDVTTAGLSYTATGITISPSAQDLISAGSPPVSIMDRYTRSEDGDGEVPEWLGELAEKVTEDAANRAEKAVLLQEFFTRPHTDPELGPDFRYDLSQTKAGSGMEDLDDFLRTSRTGYCEQFAAAMALMAREVGIPARIAVGFLKPDAGTTPGTFVFSAHDLHAWPELFFEDVGWVRFEPTPGSRTGAEPPSWTEGVIAPEIEPTQEPTAASQSADPTQQPSASASPNLPEEDPLIANTEEDGGGIPTGILIGFGLVVLCGVLAALPAVLRANGRRRRWSAARTPDEVAEAAWAELRDSCVDLRIGFDDHATPREATAAISSQLCRRPGAGEEYRAQVIKENPAAQAALDRLVNLVERSRYAAITPEPAGVRDDVTQIVDALTIGVTPQTRRRARFWPVSLLQRGARPTSSRERALELSEPGR